MINTIVSVQNTSVPFSHRITLHEIWNYLNQQMDSQEKNNSHYLLEKDEIPGEKD